MKRVPILILLILLSDIICVRFKHPIPQPIMMAERENPRIEKIKCIFYIKKGCKISKKIYVNGKREIERRISANTTEPLYVDIKWSDTSYLPECNRTNLNLDMYDPVYVVNEIDRSKIIGRMVGKYDNSTEALIDRYNVFLAVMCAAQDRFQETSFINMLKIIVCTVYDLKGAINQTTLLNIIQQYAGSGSGNLFNKNIVNLNDSMIFNPAYEEQINARLKMQEDTTILQYSAPMFYSLKKRYNKEDGFKSAKSYFKNAHNVYKTFNALKNNSTDERFVFFFKRELKKKKKSIGESIRIAKNVFYNIPKILESQNIKTKVTNFLEEAYYSAPKIYGYIKAIKTDLYYGHTQYYKQKNHTFDQKIEDDELGLWDRHTRSVNQYTHYLNAMNAHLLRTRKNREELHRKNRDYHEKHLGVYKKKNDTWKDNFDIHPQTMKLWQGFGNMGKKDIFGRIRTNKFNINSIFDYIAAYVVWVNYVYNPIFAIFGLYGKITPIDVCLPFPPKFPDERNGCLYPVFEGAPGGFIASLFPVGFDMNNPQCEPYFTFWGWSLGFIRIPGTLILGQSVKTYPSQMKWLGLDYLALNSTGQPGLAALPPNLLPCLFFFGLWAFVFFLVAFVGIVVSVLLFVFCGRVEMRYLELKTKRDELFKLDQAEYELQIARDKKAQLIAEIKEKMEEGILVGKHYDFMPIIDPNVKLYIDLYFNKHENQLDRTQINNQ